MTDIVSRIDAVIADVTGCACGCGVPLAPDGPSPWFASEHCQEHWHRGGADTSDMEPESRLGEHLSALYSAWGTRLDRLVGIGTGEGAVQAAPTAIVDTRRTQPVIPPDQFAALGRRLAEAIADAWRQLAPALEQLRRAGAIPEAPPTDPRERALHLRRTRNTGPSARPSAPRRIDPRRSR